MLLLNQYFYIMDILSLYCPGSILQKTSLGDNALGMYPALLAPNLELSNVFSAPRPSISLSLCIAQGQFWAPGTHFPSLLSIKP